MPEGRSYVKLFYKAES